MSATEWHGEFVADFSAERSALSKAKVVRVRGASGRRSGTAVERQTAGALCHECDEALESAAHSCRYPEIVGGEPIFLAQVGEVQ